ncbi:MAG TPA: endo-1,4-beta-xylanase [Candidatus Prevotella avicola]|uniref:Beta-xylanase n=1 Tax=Candidatus Prevotella avicola TaxID=2838738 RepID=A0A9D2FXV2_9BACT|nr:endo-1,4-beta-xylanase [Candidatus Prevotella avicola]
MVMKHLDKLIPMAMGLAMLTSCADNDMPFFAVTDPGTNAQYAYLNEYDVLKNYIPSTANPNFKLGLGVDAGSFADGNAQYQIAVTNFNEVTPGNEMKYASIVHDDGFMDFGTVESFVQDAKDAGLTIYGHTLAWHSQQNVKYLNSLIADRVIDTGESGEVVETEDAYVDYSTFTSFPYFVMGYTPEFKDGCMVSTYPGEWYQYFIADKIPTEIGQNYTVTLSIKTSAPASMNLQFGNWGALTDKTINTTGGVWEEITVDYTNCQTAESFVVLQPGTFDGEVQLRWTRVTHSEEEEQVVNEYLYQNDFSGTEMPGGWGDTGPSFTIEQGAGPDGTAAYKITNPKAMASYQGQFAVDFDTPLTNGEKYFVSYWIKGSGSGNLGNGLQAPNAGYASAGEFGNAAFNTEWKQVTLSCTCSRDDATRLIFSFGDFVGDIYIDDLQFYIQKPANMEPLTPEEKKDTLTWAMDQWITGIMNATGGYVTAWDAVNEAISGGDSDGDGWFDLQSADTSDDPANNFYWQDYLTPEDYVPIVTKLATQRFEEAGGDPSQLKLFINDYNLESAWDDNAKLKSMIHWIKDVWEPRGAKIDGIGSQMHVTYNLDEAAQKNQEDHIVKMFELLASSGKLVKISELDMGITGPNGTITTDQVTYEQQLKMADFYKFIIEKYFEIIPQAQQYGITQWCCTDSPANSGWRPGEPVGLWDANYSRTPSYGGFANGLAGKVIVEPSPVPGDGSDAGAAE